MEHDCERRAAPRAGFTVIELLVVAAIIVVISAIILANNARFGGVVRLENLAYDIALSIRQAQVYGIAVEGFENNGSQNNFAAGYGVHFDLSNKTDYVLFADASASQTGLYDYDPNKLIQDVKIQNGDVISSLCYTPQNGSKTCETNSDSGASLDIFFKRPEPDAFISVNNNSCLSGGCATQAWIVLSSPSGDAKSVIVYDNGQITVGNGSQ